MKTLGSVQSDNKSEAWDLHYTVSWLVNSGDPYILFVLIQWKFVPIKLHYMEILGLMNWALIDIWEESQFINFRLSHMSENPRILFT